MAHNISISDGQQFNRTDLFNLFRQVYATSDFMSEVFEEKFPSPDGFAKFLEGVTRLPGGFFLIAHDRNECFGYLMLEPVNASRLKHTAWLNMGITMPFRGRGIGKTLIDAAINRTRSENVIEIIYLMVREDNHPALRLYQGKGFEILARLDNDTKIGKEYYTGLMLRKFI